MRRLAAIAAALAVGALLFVFGSAAGGEQGTYLVRAIFDNGGFIVAGEDVRIAGATVGSVDSVDVSGIDEAVREDGSPEPGKAVIVMAIEDPAFQDFREDAECLIRPQSLLGEKFVECRQTQPHAPGTEPPPALEVIPEGEPGAGQHLLPLEQNGKAVDLDLVNDIMREPYPDRFRLILNDLGAGLAARGEDLDEVVHRANPALRRTDEVLAILARQNRQLASLARDGDRVLGPLAAQRQHIGGFINNATTAATATAERRADLEAGLQKLPGFLTELRATMTQLDDFATQSTPVVSDLGDAAPDLLRINLALGPFSDAGTTALRSLGNAADQAGPDLVASEPVLGDLKGLAKKTRPVAADLSKLLSSLRKTGGFKYLMQLIFNTAGAVNGFDSYGHFLRTLVPLNNCVDYVPEVVDFVCDAHFRGSASKLRAASKARQEVPKQAAEGGSGNPSTAGGSEPGASTAQPAEPTQTIPFPTTPPPPADEDPGYQPPPQTTPDAKVSMRDARVLLDFLVGPRRGRGPEGKR